MTRDTQDGLLEDERAPVEQIFFDERLSFQRVVMARAGSRCNNCGSEDRVRVKMIVPEEAGGVLIASNGVALCRTCDMARDSVPGATARDSAFVVTIWMSQKLHQRIEQLIEPKKSFRSWSALTRYLIAKYVSDERRFDDLNQYQDGSPGAKITVRVDKAIYGSFAALMKRRGTTVTEGLRGLFSMFAAGAGSVVNGR